MKATTNKYFTLTSNKCDIDLPEISIFSEADDNTRDDAIVLTVDLIKENGIIQEVVINKAEYFDNNTWDKTIIDITSDMQNVANEIIMIYDETAFGEPEPRCNSIYDYYDSCITCIIYLFQSCMAFTDAFCLSSYYDNHYRINLSCWL